MPSSSPVRIIVRLPYNRPEDAPEDPPRVEWNAEKEHILWEVIAKSRAMEGNTDWKGLAAHLEVPHPYLMYRAKFRFEEDLRGLQGMGIGVTSPLSTLPSAVAATSPLRPNGATPGEYFPRVTNLSRPPLSLPNGDTRLACSSTTNGPASASTSAAVHAGTSTLRPALGVRARLSSLGRAHGRALAQHRTVSGQEHVQSPLSANPAYAYPSPSKKVSSSTITLQGPVRKTRSPMGPPLSPASSRAGSSSDGANGGDDDMSDEEDEESDEDVRREEEAERQESLARKLQNLGKLITEDTLGLVAERRVPVASSVRLNGSGSGLVMKPRGRTRPMSASMAMQQQRPSPSRSQSHRSLSSASVDSPQDSPQGSIPSIPSSSHTSHRNGAPRLQPLTHTRHRSQGQTAPVSALSPHHHLSRSHSQSLSSHSLSQSPSNSTSYFAAHSPTRATSPPPARPSPPAVSYRAAQGRAVRTRRADLVAGTPTGSEASSFSDISDSSLSQSALQSALMSNIQGGGGSRFSSFARSNAPARRSTRS
ncbi:uncharacterized protein BXZ73DRAFT_99571 [Epithele typhae]|uniref:uncharacterized protein n=1 Tax=Epithele typhae TaxID=378194 RepID=UPI0020086831|nr:uncharacterized protein BXZ73DRAFT_99571 [Epithele typhae]KAH9939368.1 hypothetical protein BXZ73DRAFT_99571 [Epithele typhae]